MRMKCGFFRTETFRHSQSIWTNPPILVCDGMEQRERERECCTDLIIDEKGQENMFMIVCGGMG